VATRSPFHTDARFSHHRTFRAMWPGLLITAIGVVGVVLATLFMPALVEASRDQAENASSTRSATLSQFNPIATWLLAVGALSLGAYLLLTAREVRHVESGNRLRRIRSMSFEGGRAQMMDVYNRFMSGDPAQFTPLPNESLTRGANAHLQVWDVPEDSVAYISPWTGSGRNAEYTGLIRYENAHYRALKAAIAHSKLRKPLPNELNPLLTEGTR
jgi:hypothetical protein